jgi:hypothetical protein
VWKDPDEEGLIQFLVNEKGFNLDRVRDACMLARSLSADVVA